MANIASARKRARQNEDRRQQNAAQRARLRTSVKNVLRAVASGDKAAAQAAYQSAVPVIDSGVSKHLIHKNKAARHKSRLNARIKALD